MTTWALSQNHLTEGPYCKIGHAQVDGSPQSIGICFSVYLCIDLLIAQLFHVFWQSSIFVFLDMRPCLSTKTSLLIDSVSASGLSSPWDTQALSAIGHWIAVICRSLGLLTLVSLPVSSPCTAASLFACFFDEWWLPFSWFSVWQFWLVHCQLSLHDIGF